MWVEEKEFFVKLKRKSVQTKHQCSSVTLSNKAGRNLMEKKFNQEEKILYAQKIIVILKSEHNGNVVNLVLVFLK